MSTRTIYQKTSAELVVYPHNLEPTAIKSKGDSASQPGLDPLTSGPRLVSLDTSKAMGAPGTWSASVKVPRSQASDFEDSIIDGDWVDILLSRGAKRFHVMRGIVDANDPIRNVTAGGADTWVYELSGFDHQGIFERTPIWLSSYSAENLFGGAALRASILTGNLFGLGGVRETVSGILYGFLSVLNGYGRSIWPLPNLMPSGGGTPFAAVCARLFDTRVDQPSRIASGASLMAYENRMIWQLAAEWAEEQFNELWCDLARSAPDQAVVTGNLEDELSNFVQYEPYLLGPEDALGPDQTQLAVFLRRRPFPTAEDSEGLTFGPWSTLPTATILPQELTGTPLHRGGEERFNLIEVNPATIQELVAQSMTLLAPLVDVDDVNKRGVRPLSMRSRYHANIPQGVSDHDLAEMGRRILVDWHCLNPRYLSGQLSLRSFRPGIRVGHVATVTSNPNLHRGRGVDDDVSFYVEQVRHYWRAPGSGRTELGVTRGFRGGDDARYAALRKARARFRPLAPSPVVLAGQPLETTEGIA